MLPLFLVEGEDGAGREILVHPHVILEILVAGVAAQQDALVPVFEREVVGDDRPLIAAGVVEVDRLHVPVIRVAAAREQSVGESALVRVVGGERVGDSQIRVEPAFQLDASAYVVFLVHAFSIVSVGVETVVVVVIHRRGESYFLAELAIVGGFHLILSVASGGDGEAFPLEIERRDGVDVHDAAHGVSSVQRPLRAAQYLDSLDVGQLEVEGALVEVGYVVDVQADRLPAASGSDAADVDSGGQFRPVIGDEQVGGERTDVFQRLDLPARDHAGREDRDGAWQRAQVVGLFRG